VTTSDLRFALPAAGTLRAQRMARAALFLAVALSAVTVALVVASGIANVDFPLKVAALAVVGAAAVGLTIYRPVLFPFVAFLAAVPFDTMLQTGSGTITKFLGLATAVVALLVMVDRRRTITPPAALAGWAAFLAWSVASLMWAQDPWFGLPLLMLVAELFVLYAALSMLRVRQDEVRWMLLTSLAGGVVCAFYGIYMFVSGHVERDDALSQRLDIASNGGSGGFINADHFGGILVFPMAIALVGFLRLRGFKRAVAGAAFFVLMGGVLVSATRGALVAIAVMAVYLAVVERKRMLVAFLAAGGLLASIALPNIWMRFLDPTQGGFGGRTGIWQIAWYPFREHWLFGDGSGDFRLAYADGYLHVFQTGFFHPWEEYSHNLLVSTGVELGVVGLVLVLAAWFLQFRAVARIPRAVPFGAVRSAIEAGTLGLFVVSMTIDVMWYKYVWVVFILGTMARNAWLAQGERTALP
jgi:O-antigen ligase